MNLFKKILFFPVSRSAIFRVLVLVTSISYPIASRAVFLDYDQLTEESNDEKTKETESKIESLFQKVTLEKRLVSMLDSSYCFSYPIGIQSENGDLSYAIILDQDKITTAGMFLSAYMRFQIPGTEKIIMFKADGICLSSKGGITGNVNIHLVGRKRIPLIKGVDMLLEGDNTYVTFDCGGFKSFTLGGKIFFSPNLLVTEDIVTGERKGDKIAVSFTQSMTDWNDMLFSISISPFQFTTFPGFGFDVKNLIFDLSDTRNAVGMKFPLKYTLSDEANTNINLWRGIYIQSATVRLPNIQKKEKRSSISAEGIIIDDLGYSGSFTASNVIPLSSGTIGGWAFSLDGISVDLVNSSITKGELFGQITLPIAKTGQSLSYTAVVTDSGDFAFTVSSPKNIEVPCFYAQMTVDASSRVCIRKTQGNYIAQAILNGTININAPVGKNNTSSEIAAAKNDNNVFSVSNLRFQGLSLSSMSPYFSMGTWSLNSAGYKDKANGFEVTISNIKTVESGLEKSLIFNCSLGLMKGKYAATAAIAVNGIMDTTYIAENNYRHRWKYSYTEIKGIFLKCSDDVIGLEGYFAIYNNNKDYGDGISGSIKAAILPSSLNIQLAATAIFGNLDKTRYWYFDALAAFKKGTPLGPMSLYGFGGGAYYHMKRVNGEEVLLKEENTELTDLVIGVTASGLKYVPDVSTGIGLKATIILGLSGDPKPFNGDATLEIAFNTNGGINTIGFYGNGYLMSEIVIGKPRPDAPLKATLDISYDFNNKSLHGVLAVTVNAAKGIISGSGKLEMHFDPNKWYIYVGTPQSRISMTANLMGLIKVNTTAYFVIGTVLPPFAEPDPEVLGILKIDYKKPSENQDIIKAKGFAFGMSYSYKTDKLTLAIFYAQFGIGMGFDVMLANFGSSTICIETGETVGMNGWYAMGQAYAYVKGEIGACVKFLGKKYSKKILGIAAAVLLEAQLPNPTWLKGTVGGEWELFGGMISGNCRFKVELGTKCTMKALANNNEKESALEGMDIISALTPENNRTDIDVFANPQVVYNYRIGKEFEVAGDNDITFSVRIISDYFKITAGGKDIIGDFAWNSRNDVYVFTPKEILPPNAQITLSAKVHFEENTGTGWHIVYEGGKAVEQSLTSTFTTGKAPDYIPENNVAYQYPSKDQLNFLKSEYNKGFVKLIKGQSYLFNPGVQWVQMAKFTPVKDGSPKYLQLQYDASNYILNYSTPSDLSNETVYKFNLVNVPKNSSAIDKNVTQKSKEKQMDTIKVTLKEQVAEGELKELQEKTIYESYFRTSKYSTFMEKMSAITVYFAGTINVETGLDILKSSSTLPEDFDIYEAGKNTQPLIKYIADSEGRWIKVYAKDIVYYKYPVASWATIKWRDTSTLGLVPIKAVAFDYSYIKTLTEDAKSTGIYSNQNLAGNYYFKLGYYSKLDYREILSKLMNYGGSNPDILRYLYSDYMEYPFVLYPITCKYVLPNGIQTSTATVAMPRL